MRVQDGDLGVPVERRLAGEGLVEDAGERIDVGSRIDLAPLDLLRR